MQPRFEKTRKKGDPQKLKAACHREYMLLLLFAIISTMVPAAILEESPWR